MNKQVRVALLTGVEFSGKTFISNRLRREPGLPVLDSDVEVMRRSFEILQRPELSDFIGSPERWAPLRQDFDFDRLFRLHHRDWFARTASPPAFIAEGWVYLSEEWREQVRSAFSQLPNLQFDYQLFVLHVPRAVHLERYRRGVEERNPEEFASCDEAHLVNWGTWIHSRLSSLWEPPQAMSHRMIADSDECFAAIRDFCRAT